MSKRSKGSKRTIRVICNDLNRTRHLHSSLNSEIDAMQRRQGLGNSMDLQGKKTLRATHRRRIDELEAELAAAKEQQKTKLVATKNKEPLPANAEVIEDKMPHSNQDEVVEEQFVMQLETAS